MSSQRENAISMLAQRHAKELFASDLVLANRKFIDIHSVFDSIYMVVSNMLESFQRSQYENKFDESDFNSWNGEEFDTENSTAFHDFVCDWMDELMEPLCVVPTEHIYVAMRDEYENRVISKIVEILRDYHKTTQK